MTAVLMPTRHQVMLHGVSWATYQGLIRDLESDPGKRLTEVVLRPQGSQGFVLLPRRWVVERTYGWLHWCRRLNLD